MSRLPTALSGVSPISMYAPALLLQEDSDIFSTVNRPLRVQSRLPFPILVWFSLAAVDFVKDAFFVSYDDRAYILHGCIKLY